MALPPNLLHELCRGTAEDVYLNLKNIACLSNSEEKNFIIECIEELREEAEKYLAVQEGTGLNGFDFFIRLLEKSEILNEKGKTLASTLERDVTDCENCGARKEFKKNIFCSNCNYLLDELNDFFFSKDFCRECGVSVIHGHLFCYSCKSVQIEYGPDPCLGCHSCGKGVPIGDYYCTYVAYGQENNHNNSTDK